MSLRGRKNSLSIYSAEKTQSVKGRRTISWGDLRCQMTSSLSFGFEGPTPLLESVQYCSISLFLCHRFRLASGLGRCSGTPCVA